MKKKNMEKNLTQDQIDMLLFMIQESGSTDEQAFSSIDAVAKFEEDQRRYENSKKRQTP